VIRFALCLSAILLICAGTVYMYSLHFAHGAFDLLISAIALNLAIKEKENRQ
jgi:hypothetical protein